MVKSEILIIIGILSTVVLATVGSLLYGPQPAESEQQQQQQRLQMTDDLIFTDLFEQQLDSAFSSANARVVYQSQTTVVLEGDLLIPSIEDEEYTDNQYLWQAVDIVKSYGYYVDSVTVLGDRNGDNSLQYNVIMSRGNGMSD